VRIRITFNVNNRGGLVPFHHQYLISKAFKPLLSESSAGKFKDYPFFSFSGIKGQTRLGRKGLHFNSRKVTIVISSASKEFIDVLVPAVLEQKELTIGELNITPEIAEIEKPVNFERGTKYVCISPMIINPATGGERIPFMSPETNEFSDLLYESTIERLADYGLDINSIPDAQKFQIVPDENYLKKIKSLNKKFSRVYPMYENGEKRDVRGYTFPFTLFAAREIQDFIFTCGLGNYCAEGFGLLDLANVDPVSRTEPYLLP